MSDWLRDRPLVQLVFNVAAFIIFAILLNSKINGSNEQIHNEMTNKADKQYVDSVVINTCSHVDSTFKIVSKIAEKILNE